jgi:hypothetical protein
MAAAAGARRVEADGIPVMRKAISYRVERQFWRLACALTPVYGKC